MCNALEHQQQPPVERRWFNAPDAVFASDKHDGSFTVSVVVLDTMLKICNGSDTHKTHCFLSLSHFSLFQLFSLALLEKASPDARSKKRFIAFIPVAAFRIIL